MAGKFKNSCGMLAVVLMLMIAGSANGGLIHRYSFTDGAKDSAGKVDGTLKGGAKVADGKLALANGDKSSADTGIAYLEFPGKLLPKEGSASIAIWFTGKEVGAFSRLLDIGAKEATEGSAFIYITPHTGDDTTRVAISASDPGSKSNVDTERLDDGKSHMIAMVIDAKAKKLHLYVDGKEAGTAVDLGDNTLDKVKPDHAWVGRSAFDADGALTATLDEMRFYDEALTADQIAACYKAGADALPEK